MPYFLSIIIPRIPTPISLVSIPTYRSNSSGGKSLGFNMGDIIPSTYAIPTSILVMSSVGFPFGWNMLSGSGVVPSYSRGSVGPQPSFGETFLIFDPLLDLDTLVEEGAQKRS
jgi:hypothetical protein